jgi:SagB-type dehydrogenase family enzyme
MSLDENRSKRFEKNRFFLKDSIRQQIDFSSTAQYRRLPAPELQKPCDPEVLRIGLPDGRASLLKLGCLSTSSAIIQRESLRDYSEMPLTLEELAALLWATQGVRSVLNPGCALRTVPSAGARHAFETYLGVNRVDGLAPGLYRYLPFDSQLAQLSLDAQIGDKAVSACLGQKFLADAALIFFWSTIPARMEWRYDAAAHKVIAVDVGHVCQNLYLAATSLGAGACAIAAYDQTQCDLLLGLDGDEEFVVYLAAVGKRA